MFVMLPICLGLVMMIYAVILFLRDKPNGAWLPTGALGFFLTVGTFTLHTVLADPNPDMTTTGAAECEAQGKVLVGGACMDDPNRS